MSAIRALTRFYGEATDPSPSKVLQMFIALLLQGCAFWQLQGLLSLDTKIAHSLQSMIIAYCRSCSMVCKDEPLDLEGQSSIFKFACHVLNLNDIF